MKKAICAVAILGLLIAATVLLFPQWKIQSLSRQLDEAKTPVEAAAVAREILEYNTPNSSALVVQWAATSPLRAFDARNSVLLIHDPSNGKIYHVVTAPRGSVEVPPDSKLSATEQENLRSAVFEAVPRITEEVQTIGTPPKVFSEIHLLREPTSNERARFVLKVEGKEEYYEIRVSFEGSRLVSQGLHDVSQEDVRNWKFDGTWAAPSN